MDHLRTAGATEAFRNIGWEAQHLKVLVADDHHLLREGMKLALREIAQTVDVLEADTLARAVAVYQANPDVDLVLLDLSMPGSSGLSGIDTFERECPTARVVVVSASCDMNTIQAVVRRGVLGFIPKLAGKDILLSALRFVLAGGIYVPPEVLAAGAELPPETDPRLRVPAEGLLGLTTRQIEVLALLAEGLPNKEICVRLGLSMGTIKGHVAAVLQALGAQSRGQAIANLDRMGLRAKVQYAQRGAAAK